MLTHLPTLPLNLSQHLLITAIALIAGIAISLPLGLLAARRARLRYSTLAFVSVIQTIPSLALLALMVPLIVVIASGLSHVGIKISALGFWPTIIALTLYSMLPVVRNTVTGLLGVDPAVSEAARGVGMSDRQRLFRVELPLAMPVILAGIRTATVWVVGIATLSTPVGQRSLGNFIFRGLQTRNWSMVLLGCISAALLALLLDLLLGGIERAAAQRRKPLAIVCISALAVLLIGGIASPAFISTATRQTSIASTQPTDDGSPRPTVRIGAKTFTEQYILASVLSQTLESQGFPTRELSSLGSTVVFDALTAGEIDMYVDYSGTVLANYMKQTHTPSRETVLESITWWLAREHNIRCLGPLGFENTYALAMPRARAEALGIRTIEDLRPHARKMKIGGDYEFFGRPEWTHLLSTYDLTFAEQVSYDSTFMYEAAITDAVQVICAFSSDGRLDAFDLVTLEDTRQAFPPYDAVLLVGPTVADDEGVLGALRPLIAGISVEAMREANHLVDRDDAQKVPPRVAAQRLRERIGK